MRSLAHEAEIEPTSRQSIAGRLVLVRFHGGLLDGRSCLMCSPDRWLRMEDAGRTFQYGLKSESVELVAGIRADTADYVVHPASATSTTSRSG